MEYFTPHLAALEPDWVIISLGTNDVYTYVFDTLDFTNKVDSLIGNVKKAAPMAAILLTTPSDHRIKKGEVNRNVAQASAILKNKAKQWSISYWDYYTVMGGQGSIDYWRSTGMAHTDYLHYTQKGYEYQSQLMFNAFLNSYDDYLAKEILK
jgi:lysophospholipase L1-like esterase